MTSRRIASLSALLLTAGCLAPARSPTRYDISHYKVLTQRELAQTSAVSAWDAAVLLRPQLRNESAPIPRRFRVQPPPRVYIDGALEPDTEVLKRVPAKHIAEIRVLSAADALLRYGPYHDGGAIVVTTSRRP